MTERNGMTNRIRDPDRIISKVFPATTPMLSRGGKMVLGITGGNFFQGCTGFRFGCNAVEPAQARYVPVAARRYIKKPANPKATKMRV
ncbi:MAG: hypothetical protein WAM73_00330 [Desulfobacterales bacterium]